MGLTRKHALRPRGGSATATGANLSAPRPAYAGRGPRPWRRFPPLSRKTRQDPGDRRYRPSGNSASTVAA